MTSRFPSLIASINGAIKHNIDSVSCPCNVFSISVLKKLRDYGAISGFSYDFESGKPLHPRVKIFIKKHISGIPVIRSIKVFPRTRTNFKTIKYAEIYKAVMRKNKKLLISTPQGLFFSDELVFHNKGKNIGGILILEVVL